MEADLDKLLSRLVKDEPSREESLKILRKVRNYSELIDLMRTASKVRDDSVGRVYKFEAFMGPITKCTTTPPCKYCRRSVKGKSSFDEPLTIDEIRVGAELIAKTGIGRLEIGGGTLWSGAGKYVIEAVKVIKNVVPNIKIRVNVGPSLSRDDLLKLKELGVDEISSNFETMNRKVFRNVKPGDSLDARISLAKEVDKVGLKLSTVMMVGIGSNYEDYVDHIFWFKDNIRNLSRFAITGFKPIPGTPMESKPMASPFEVAKVGALVRLVFRRIDVSFGGIMNDIRLLPLRVMAGENREIHLSVSFHRKWNYPTLSPSEIEVVEVGKARFVNNLPLITRIIRDLGLEPESL